MAGLLDSLSLQQTILHSYMCKTTRYETRL